jgi:2-oxoglutarate ferredoxin oxidoreductase subunit gamma
MVCLGIIAKLSGLVTLESLLLAMRARVPKGTTDINQRALEAGYGLAVEPATVGAH